MILAAVIAAFVFGMGSNIGKTKVVAMTASRSADGTAIFVTYQGGQDHPSVASVGSTCSGGTQSANWNSPPNVGDSVSYTGLTAGTKYHVTANATFNDGTAQVILDTYV